MHARLCPPSSVLGAEPRVLAWAPDVCVVPVRPDWGCAAAESPAPRVPLTARVLGGPLVTSWPRRGVGERDLSRPVCDR